MRRLLALLASLILFSCVSHVPARPMTLGTKANLVLCSANYDGPGVTLNCRQFSENELAHSNPHHELYGAASRPPIIPASWTNGTWDIDPSNTTGCANDNNSCSSATCGSGGVGPCLTWAEVIARLGTYAPRLRQATVFLFLSSQPDTTDPVYLAPFIEAGAPVSILGTLVQVQAGNFSALVQKNRATPQLLNVTFASSSGLRVGLLVVDTARNSRAWTYVNTSGSSWNMSQPLPTPSSNGNITPNQDNTWANGDSYTVYAPPLVALRRVMAHVAGFGSTNNPLLVKDFVVPAGTSNDTAHFGGNGITVAETSFLGTFYMEQAFAKQDNACLNCDFAGFGASIKADVTADAAIFVVGGQSRGTIFCPSGAVSVQSDFIVDSIANLAVPGATFALGSVYIESGKTLAFSGTGLIPMVSNSNYGKQIWGPGALDVGGTCRLAYPSGAAQAAATFLQTGGFTINGATSCVLAGRGSALVAGKTVGVTGLDADLGATPGAYTNPGGASVTNEAN